MKKQLLFMFLVPAVVFTAVGQATIKATAVKQKDSEYEVRLTVKVETGWHIYSGSTPESGPLPTTVSFKKNPVATLLGKVKEQGKLIEKHEQAFDMKVKYYENEVVFIQKIIVKGKAKTNVSATIEYMLCSDEKCLPPKAETFDIKLE